MPLPSLIDADPTGSIKPEAPSLSSAYDSRDWRVAEPVLAASLRAPGQAEPAVWSNAGDRAITENSSPSPGPSRARANPAAPSSRGSSTAKTPRRSRPSAVARESGEVAVYDVSPWTGL